MINYLLSKTYKNIIYLFSDIFLCLFSLRKNQLTIDVIVFNKSSSLPKYVHTTLMSIVNLILTNRWITVWCYPHTSKIVRVNFVLNKLATSIFVHINAPCLAVVNFTLNHSWVGPSLHLESSYTVVMNITALKVALEQATQMFNSGMFTFS